MSQPPEDLPSAPSWFDIGVAAAAAAGFAAWAASIYQAQGLEPALGVAAVAVWVAVFTGLRVAARRRILRGKPLSVHAANLERTHSVVGAVLFTVLGVLAAKDARWLTAAGFLTAAAIFGLGGVKARV
jgi:hypothetical protein